MGGIVSKINPFSSKSKKISNISSVKSGNIDDDSSLNDDYKLGANNNNDDNSSIYTGTLNDIDSNASITGLPFRGRHIYINTINIKHPEEHKWLQSHSHYILEFLHRYYCYNIILQ